MSEDMKFSRSGVPLIGKNLNTITDPESPEISLLERAKRISEKYWDTFPELQVRINDSGALDIGHNVNQTEEQRTIVQELLANAFQIKNNLLSLPVLKESEGAKGKLDSIFKVLESNKEASNNNKFVDVYTVSMCTAAISALIEGDIDKFNSVYSKIRKKLILAIIITNANTIVACNGDPNLLNLQSKSADILAELLKFVPDIDK